MDYKYFRTIILVIIAASALITATSVYGFLSAPVSSPKNDPPAPSFKNDIEYRPLPEPVPIVPKPDIITVSSKTLKKVYQQAAEINSVSSLLIRQEKTPIIEDYFGDMEAGRAVNIKSASKSILSLLVGIALERGILKSVRQPIHPFFPDYFSARTDPVKRSITIEDLLTMRAGLETTSFHNYGQWVSSDNWVRYVLEQPVVEKPGGEKMIYSTGSSHLLSVILTKASGMSSRAFAQKYLFDPMGIELENWWRDPQGYYMGGNNMFLKPSDMMKIGQMVLNGGIYWGQQVVPEEWLEDSFRTYTQSNNNSSYYGYMWWKKEVKGYQTLFACGYGGQYIFMLPELESVVVITSYLKYANHSRHYNQPIFRLLEDTIIPYILEKGADDLSVGLPKSGAVSAR